MAICQDCDQEMLEAAGCTLSTVPIAGVEIARVRYGQERPAYRGRRCGDCNVEHGQLHHLGCDVERCPTCHWQLISCGCWTDGEDDDEEDLDGVELIEDAILDAQLAVAEGARLRLAHRCTSCTHHQ